jgi:hypothetical protein
MSQPTRPDAATRDAERAEAETDAQPDKMPTPEEEREAEKHKVDPSVREHAQEMTERGANQDGEGRVP